LLELQKASDLFSCEYLAHLNPPASLEPDLISLGGSQFFCEAFDQRLIDIRAHYCSVERIAGLPDAASDWDCLIIVAAFHLHHPEALFRGYSQDFHELLVLKLSFSELIRISSAQLWVYERGSSSREPVSRVSQLGIELPPGPPDGALARHCEIWTHAALCQHAQCAAQQSNQQGCKAVGYQKLLHRAPVTGATD
jgi:hypothetical protein